MQHTINGTLVPGQVGSNDIVVDDAAAGIRFRETTQASPKKPAIANITS